VVSRSEASAVGSEVTTTAESTAPQAAPPSRLDRRKALTRQKLIDAARAMLAAGTATDASIQQITETADVGFGSFYNHFSTKTELFEAAVTDVLEELGALFDRLSVDVEDPALAYAQSTRLTLRLCRSRPQLCAVLVRHGMHYMEAEDGVAPRLLRDLQAGMATGRFRQAEPRLVRAAVSGAVLATLQMALTDPELVDDAACDQLVEQLLRLLGVPFDEARQLAHAPLPDTELPEPS
jgi:AcrR family transcriptional regulator